MEQKKKIIMDMAMKVFGEKEFKNATISEIATEAGVGDATIYEHFKNNVKESYVLTKVRIP